MQSVVVQKADQMPEPLRSAVEQLLGRPLASNEEVSIVATSPNISATSENGAAVARKLEALLNRRMEKVADIPDTDIDAIIDEAVDAVRHRPR